MAWCHPHLFIFLLWFSQLVSFPLVVESSCTRGCNLALASYEVWDDLDMGFVSNLSFISSIFGGADIDEIVRYSQPRTTRDFILTGSRLLIPFRCDCVNQTFLGHCFKYAVKEKDTYSLISRYYSNLTAPQLLQSFGNSSSNRIGDDSGSLDVVVYCSCGNSSVSDDYGLFVTYPLMAGETLMTVAAAFNLSEILLQKYNPNTNFSSGTGVVYIPAKDVNGSYRPLVAPGNGISGGVVAGISIVVMIFVVLLVVGFYIIFYKKRSGNKPMLLSTSSFGERSSKALRGSFEISCLTVNESVEFSYQELANATNNFNSTNKIGEGGFGSVYYAELRGEKAAIKKMDMHASKQFLAELKILTNVHHFNLVRLIGYCAQNYLFMVYEYIGNGNLSQHLCCSGKNEPLTWSTRLQIALDSARGLEYMHEHMVPVYIHRDIKSANILIDKNFHGKVADFGLTKLTKVGNSSRPTHLVGTLGYMPPEYARNGVVSSKVDVFAFGVVLFEIISAKEAILRTPIVGYNSKSLVALFDEVFSQPDPQNALHKVVDPKLGNNFPLKSVWKVAQLGKACTQDDPKLRPTIKSVVIALMSILSSTTEESDVVSFYENQALADLLPGR